MSVPTSLGLLTCAVLLGLLPAYNAQTISSNCGPDTFTNLTGNINSPNYPFYYYLNYQYCIYAIVAPSLSTIKFTFNVLAVEQQNTCTYDWIEFICENSQISRRIRYCGSGYRPDLIFKPCARVLISFRSDGIGTGIGFSVSYNIEPIKCQNDCLPIATSVGYNCNCDANQTILIASTYGQCPVGCSNTTSYCACSLPVATTPASTTTTTIATTATTVIYKLYCGQSTFSGLSGNITSPYYPGLYENNQFCNYAIVASSLSTIKFIFNALGIEQHDTCSYDWIEFTCESNSISRRIRYCGSGYRAELSFKPCSRVVMAFRSDGVGTGIGFSVSYNIEPITCKGDCTPVATAVGYNCTCDANQTPYIAPPYDQCPNGCFISSPYCACSAPQTNSSTSTFTTSTSTSTTTTSTSTTTTSTSTKTTPTSTTAKTTTATTAIYNSYCGQSTFTGTKGNISSPLYPSIYQINQFCNYAIVASSLSSINFTFNVLGLELQNSCTFDWIEFTCESNSISRRIRYCGSGYRPELIFKPCSRVLMAFRSDGVVTGTGFSVSYNIEPIRCQGACSPVATSTGYNCTCDANQTSFTAPPYGQCPAGCFDTMSSAYCACSTPQTNSSMSTSTTTTTPTTPTTARVTNYAACGQTTFNGLIGNITSPNYPNQYETNQLCFYYIIAPSLSTINITFNALSIEPSYNCSNDFVEFTCEGRPVKYCGSGYRLELSFKPCSRVYMTFRSDKMITGIGFSVSYNIEPITCQGNCTPVATAAGYNCTCDANQTPFSSSPYDQCPVGCFSSSAFCACSALQTTRLTPATTRTTKPTTTTVTYYSYCGQSTFSDLQGNITSLNYPNAYENNQICNYVIVAPSLSAINFTFNEFGLEQQPTCLYDWIEFTCESHPISKPIRYCGYGYHPELSLKPCSRVLMKFRSDGFGTGIGFSLSYNIEPIRCQGDCTPLSNGAGYYCPCDANQTPYIAPPYDQCPVNCFSSYSNCACAVPQMSTPSSTSTTTTPTSTNYPFPS